MPTVSSTTRKIKYTHVPKDGRTPIYDPSTKKWTYHDNPTSTLLEASARQLVAQEQVASEAKLTADNAQSAAAAAQTTANAAQTAALSKASLSEVKKSLFPARDKDGKKVIMTSLEFYCEDDGWKFMFCFEPTPTTIGQDMSGQGKCAVLAYATRSALNSLANRVAAIEQMLGISS